MITKSGLRYAAYLLSTQRQNNINIITICTEAYNEVAMSKTAVNILSYTL